MKHTWKKLLSAFGIAFLFPLFGCRESGGSVSSQTSIQPGTYVENEVLLTVAEKAADHKAHESDAALDQAEVLMELDGNRKIVLVRDPSRTTEELLEWVRENDRVEYAEPNYLSQAQEEK